LAIAIAARASSSTVAAIEQAGHMHLGTASR
jgi:hypothetical protein